MAAQVLFMSMAPLQEGTLEQGTRHYLLRLELFLVIGSFSADIFLRLDSALHNFRVEM